MLLCLLATCVVGPQPLPPDDHLCGAMVDLSVEATGAGQYTMEGQFEGNPWAVEAVNLDSDADPYRAQVSDDGSFELNFDGEPPDRVRITGVGTSCEDREPTDLTLTTDGATQEEHGAYECIARVPLIANCDIGDSASCEVVWPVHNSCADPLIVSDVSPRRPTANITLTTELPLEIGLNELGTIRFTITGGDATSEVFFIGLEGAEEATIPVTIRVVPYR